MNWIHIILELVVVGYFIFLQVKTGVHLRGAIAKFGRFIPSKAYFQTESINIKNSLLKEGKVADIFDYVHNTEEALNASDPDTVQVILINPRTQSGTAFDAIIESLNIYLLKNNGGIADFSIVKDLVERNVNVEEDDIKETINKPLYLGLMATIVGIIFGLFTMLMKLWTGDDAATPGLVKELDLNDFLSAVCIAMVSSFLGLAITSFIGLNSFKKAKRTLEQNKNSFYNFIQTDLLPVVSQDFGSSVSKLTHTMNAFNKEFTANIHTLSHLFQKNYDTLKVQDSILDRLEHINANDFVQMNAMVLQRLEKATNNFDKFNGFMESLNARLGETRELSDSIAKLLNRANNFESIAQKIDSRVDDTHTIIDFLKQQFASFDGMNKRYQQMILGVDDNLEATLKIFENDVIRMRESLSNLIGEQHELLEKAYAENVTKFDKLDMLEHLTVLPEIKNAFDQHQSKMLSGQDEHHQSVSKIGAGLKINQSQISGIESTLKEVKSRVADVSDGRKELSKLGEMWTVINKLKEEVEKSNENIFKRIFRK